MWRKPTDPKTAQAPNDLKPNAPPTPATASRVQPALPLPRRYTTSP